MTVQVACSFKRRAFLAFVQVFMNCTCHKTNRPQEYFYKAELVHFCKLSTLH